MGGKSAPPPPDYTPLAQASEKAAKLAYQTSQEQLAWAREQWQGQQELLQNVLDTQLPIQDQQFQNAQKDRARYEQVYQPLEDNLIQEFTNYDTDARKRMEMGQAQSDVSRAFEAQRANAQRNLESYGIDPSQTRSQALDVGMRAQEAAGQAAAGTQARRNVEATGRSLRAAAIDIGRGLPSQVAGAYGQALNAGNSAIGNMNSTVSTGANTMGTGTSWMGQGTQAIGQSINALNTGYQNQMSAANFNAENGLGNMLMTGAGIAAGIAM